MKHVFFIVFLLLLGNFLFSQSLNDRMVMGEEWARTYISKNAAPSNDSPMKGRDLIVSRRMAVDIAEIILDAIYGSDTIDGEKPFEAYNFSGYWLVAGTLPKNTLGGAAVIIFSQKDGKVVHIAHYQ